MGILSDRDIMESLMTGYLGISDFSERGLRMPKDVCAQLWMRTTWIRKGCIGAFGKIDAGFEGTLTLGAYNATDDVVEIPVGERFCQMVFETLNSETVKDYAARSGHYQGQTGITLDPLKKD